MTKEDPNNRIISKTTQSRI